MIMSSRRTFCDGRQCGGGEYRGAEIIGHDTIRVAVLGVNGRARSYQGLPEPTRLWRWHALRPGPQRTDDVRWRFFDGLQEAG